MRAAAARKNLKILIECVNGEKKVTSMENVVSVCSIIDHCFSQASLNKDDYGLQFYEKDFETYVTFEEGLLLNDVPSLLKVRFLPRMKECLISKIPKKGMEEIVGENTSNFDQREMQQQKSPILLVKNCSDSLGITVDSTKLDDSGDFIQVKSVFSELVYSKGWCLDDFGAVPDCVKIVRKEESVEETHTVRDWLDYHKVVNSSLELGGSVTGKMVGNAIKGAGGVVSLVGVGTTSAPTITAGTLISFGGTVASKCLPKKMLELKLKNKLRSFESHHTEKEVHTFSLIQTSEQLHLCYLHKGEVEWNENMLKELEKLNNVPFDDFSQVYFYDFFASFGTHVKIGISIGGNFEMTAIEKREEKTKKTTFSKKIAFSFLDKLVESGQTKCGTELEVPGRTDFRVKCQRKGLFRGMGNMEGGKSILSMGIPGKSKEMIKEVFSPIHKFLYESGVIHEKQYQTFDLAFQHYTYEPVFVEYDPFSSEKLVDTLEVSVSVKKKPSSFTSNTKCTMKIFEHAISIVSMGNEENSIDIRITQNQILFPVNEYKNVWEGTYKKYAKITYQPRGSRKKSSEDVFVALANENVYKDMFSDVKKVGIFGVYTHALKDSFGYKPQYFKDLLKKLNNFKKGWKQPPKNNVLPVPPMPERHFPLSERCEIGFSLKEQSYGMIVNSRKLGDVEFCNCDFLPQNKLWDKIVMGQAKRIIHEFQKQSCLLVMEIPIHGIRKDMLLTSSVPSNYVKTKSVRPFSEVDVSRKVIVYTKYLEHSLVIVPVSKVSVMDFHQDFLRGLRELPLNASTWGNQTRFLKFLENFGTHVKIGAILGGRMIVVVDTKVSKLPNVAPKKEKGEKSKSKGFLSIVGKRLKKDFLSSFGPNHRLKKEKVWTPNEVYEVLNNIHPDDFDSSESRFKNIGIVILQQVRQGSFDSNASSTSDFVEIREVFMTMVDFVAHYLGEISKNIIVPFQEMFDAKMKGKSSSDTVQFSKVRFSKMVNMFEKVCHSDGSIFRKENVAKLIVYENGYRLIGPNISLLLPKGLIIHVKMVGDRGPTKGWIQVKFQTPQLKRVIFVRCKKSSKTEKVHADMKRVLFFH